MSKLQELIQRLCPDGVPHRKLDAYIDIYTGEQFNKRDMAERGTYPVINGGISASGYVEVYNEPKDTITISQGGASAGFVAWQEKPFWAGAHCYVIKPKNGIDNRYLFFFLKNSETVLQQMQHGAGIPALNRDKVKNLSIPVPPIEVQEEIVRILDRFSDYAAELQAELQARKEQYEYYRNLLLTFNPSACGCGTDGEQKINDVTTPPPASYKIDWKPMGEICKIITAPIKLNRKDYDTKGRYPIIDQGQDFIVGYSDRADALLPDDEYVLFGDHTKNIKYFRGSFIQGSDGLKILKTNMEVTPKYLYHMMKTLSIEDRGYNRHWSVVSPILIPIPPIELQEKIVAILDRFETLVNDLTNGLPAEIAAIKEQYEYYRNKLLTFNEKSA